MVSINATTEVDLTEDREQELADVGLIPITHAKGLGAAVFYNLPSCQDPKVYMEELGTTNARLSAQLQYILSTSRFAHYIKVIMRDKLGSVLEREEAERLLNDWLAGYCSEAADEDERAAKPLAKGEVTLHAVHGKPGKYRAEVRLVPHFHLDDLTVSLRLTTEVAPGRQAV